MLRLRCGQEGTTLEFYDMGSERRARLPVITLKFWARAEPQSCESKTAGPPVVVCDVSGTLGRRDKVRQWCSKARTAAATPNRALSLLIMTK